MEKKHLKMRQKKYVINDPVELASYDPVTFLNEVKETIIKKIKEEKNYRGSKVRSSLNFIMVKTIPTTGEETRDDAHFSSKQEIIVEGTDLEETYEKMIAKIFESLATYQKNGSDWKFEKIKKLELYISKYNPVKGSSYSIIIIFKK